MAKIIDISSKLGNEKPFLKIGDKQFKINNSLPAMIAIMAKLKASDEDLEELKDVLAIACGRELPDYLLETEASIVEWKAVMDAVVRVISGEEETPEKKKK